MKSKKRSKKVLPKPREGWWIEGMLNRIANSPLFFILAALPVGILVMLLMVYAVNVPFWDQWELVDLFKKYHDRTLTIGDFVAQHNEHRLLFPRLIMFGLAVMTGWNTLFENAVSVALALTSAFFLYQIIRATFTNRLVFLSAMVLLSAVFFSPIQWENWLWGWQIQWFLNVLGLIVAVWALTTWKTPSLAKKMIVAGLAAFVATYSLASGMFVWLVCIPLFVLQPDLRRWLWAWIGAAVVSIGIHYIGYIDPSYHPSKTLFLHQKKNFITYLLVYIARPISFDFLLAPFISIMYLVLSGAAVIYAFMKHKTVLFERYMLPWWCFALYALLADGSTAVSRLGLGVEQAYSNRYTTLSSLFLLAVIVLLWKLVELSLGRLDKLTTMVRGGSLVALAVITLLVGLNYIGGTLQMKNQHDHLLQVRECAHTARSADDECLLKLYPNKEVVWRRLEYLRSIHWGGL